MYRKILIAYNGSPESRAALEECTRMTHLEEREFHLLGVVHQPAPYLIAPEFVPLTLDDDGRRQMQEMIDKEVAWLRGMNMTVSGHVAIGEPVDQIVRVASELGVDLVVVGHRRNLSFAARWWRGSLKSALMERLHCSLLIALQVESAAEAGDSKRAPAAAEPPVDVPPAAM